MNDLQRGKGADIRLAVGDLVRRDGGGGVTSLFCGRRTHYTYRTRVAIRAACDLLSLKPGDEVLVPAYNCGSEVDPLRDAGLSIRLYAVDGRARIQMDKLESAITDRTSAIYLTHYFGFLQPDTGSVRRLCDQRGLPLIEDCALSLLSGTNPVEGRAGNVAVFCFNKFFPVTAGGALVINDGSIGVDTVFSRRPSRGVYMREASKIVSQTVLSPSNSSALRNMMRGITRSRRSDSPVEACGAGRPDMPAHYYFDPGLRGMKISAIAEHALGAFDVAQAIRARRENYQVYLEALAGDADLPPLFPELPSNVCPSSMPIRVKNRDRVASALGARGIAATPWWAGYHRHLDFTGFEDAYRLKDEVLSLPVHQYLDPEAIPNIVEQTRQLVRAMT